VAKGYSQVEGIDYLEIFSPVIHYKSIHLMFTLAALENWYITGLDVKMAFLLYVTVPHIFRKVRKFQPEYPDSRWNSTRTEK